MILFGVWAPSEDVFWQSWNTAGICTAPGVYAPGYEGIETTRSWPGIVVKTPAVMDGETIVTPAVMVNGWHTNVRVSGALADQFTYGLAQTDAEGKLKSVWDRTWATHVFTLTQQPADATTGFPAGYRNTSGVTFADTHDFTSPANVWA